MSIIWRVDPAHTEIQFKVKHLMITTVTGYFKEFDCEVVTQTEDFNTTTNIRFTANIDSIDTNNAQRDTHLKSAEFFNSNQHRQVMFTGTRYEAINDKGSLQGNLTIRGVTKPVTLDVDFAGMVVDPYGQKKAGFKVAGKLSRKDFGLTWNAVTEAGSVVVSDEVRINANVQLIKQQ